jgi:FKBP-type peptidyl-prolyl cis-trans isomerase 2
MLLRTHQSYLQAVETSDSATVSIAAETAFGELDADLPGTTSTNTTAAYANTGQPITADSPKGD